MQIEIIKPKQRLKKLIETIEELEKQRYHIEIINDKEENTEKITQQIHELNRQKIEIEEEIQEQQQQKENLNCIITQLQEKNQIEKFNEETINMAYKILEVIFTKHMNIKIEITELTEIQKEEIKEVLKILKKTTTQQTL